jgi:putative ABC transport system permease protein
MDQLNENLDQVYPGYWADELSHGLSALPLHEIHFTEGGLYELKPTANKAYLSTFGIVGLIILLIIWTNYTNLSVAMYADRKKELGMRKVLGAGSADVSLQLLTEALLLALLCGPFCWLIVQQTLPHFGALMQFDIASGIMWSPLVLLGLVGLLVVTGLLSGLYPALTYGRRSPLWLFGKKVTQFGGHRLFNFRNGVLTTQFVMVVGLLSITFFIYRQMDYIGRKDLGYQKEGIIYFNVSGAEQFEQLKTALTALPEVESVGANGVPGSEMYNQLTYKLKDTEHTFSDGTEQYLDYGTLQTLGIKCEACSDLEQGKERVFVINRTAAEKLAKVRQVAPEELIGSTLILEPEWENEEFGYGIPHVIDGIIDDYKYFSLKYPDQSQLLTVSAQAGWVYEMLVKVNTDRWSATLNKIEDLYQKTETERPFQVHFLEDRLERLYASENRAGLLMGGLSLIAIVLALMGLAGTVSYLAYSRQKEIGIRKVLGASTGQILLKFNREFLLLLGIATLIALPPSLLLSAKWLDNFAFRIAVHPWGVLVAGLGTALLVMILVSLQAARAANSRPVEVLKAD